MALKRIFVVTEEKLERAKKAIVIACRKLDQTQVMALWEELGLESASGMWGMDSTGSEHRVYVTDLQLVALAAALSAAAETGGKDRENEDLDNIVTDSGGLEQIPF